MEMYCWPENRTAWEALWTSIGDELANTDVEVPAELTFDVPLWDIWQDKNLLVGYTCGWPYISRLKDQVSLIGRFDFGLENCPAGYYESVYIGRNGMEPEIIYAAMLTDELMSVAVNGLDSQSGFRAFRDLLGEDPNEVLAADQLVHSGSHRDSIIAVANGDADIAAIDAVTWRYALDFEPAAKEVVVLGNSNPVPGLPLITSVENHNLVDQLFKAVNAAVSKPGKAHEKSLGIKGFGRAEPSDYLSLL